MVLSVNFGCAVLYHQSQFRGVHAVLILAYVELFLVDILVNCRWIKLMA